MTGQPDPAVIERVLGAWVPAYERLGHRLTQAQLQDPKGALGMCAIVVDELAPLFAVQALHVAKARITGATYAGREHWAVLLMHEADGWGGEATVVDLTARQFAAEAPTPWIGDVNDWLDDACEWLVDGLDVEWHEFGKQFGDDSCRFAERWARDDVAPGPLAYPWERASA